MLTLPMGRLRIIAVTALLTASLQAQHLQLRLHLERTEYLPAYPVHATVTIVNPGQFLAESPKGAMILRVHPEGSPSFVVPGPIDGDPLAVHPPEDSVPSVLKPHETVAFDFPLGELGTGFLSDERLWVPGRYLIEVAFLNGSVRLSQASDAEEVSRLPRTNAVELRIVEPSGSEASAWEMVRDSGILKMGLTEDRVKTARKLWAIMPASPYSSHVGRVIWPRTESERAELWPKIIAMDEEGHVRDELRIKWAMIDFEKAEHDFRNGRTSPAEALQRAEDARARLVELSTSAVTGDLRLRANNHLQRLSSRDQLFELGSRQESSTNE